MSVLKNQKSVPWGPAATPRAVSNVYVQTGSPCPQLEEGAKVNASESIGLSLFCVYLLWSYVLNMAKLCLLVKRKMFHSPTGLMITRCPKVHFYFGG